MKNSIALILSVLIMLPAFVHSAEAPQQQAPVVGGPIGAVQLKGVVSPGLGEVSHLKATVAKVVGSVVVRKKGTSFWRDAKVGEPLKSGDEIRTKDDGKIELVLENGNVIKLKSNSRIVISRIAQNRITGEYDNFFKSDGGRIWSKIEGLPGKSTFRIKTPTAVAGARGTIMYLDIYIDKTTALFEGGWGFLKNLISGEMLDIEPDYMSQADDKGNLLEPTKPSEEERQNLTGGWDIELGPAEGYSPPGGDAEDVKGDVDDTAEEQGDSEKEAQDDKKASQETEKTPYADSLGVDTDGDGISDSLDTDDDNDGYPDTNDAFSLDPTEWLDTDSDGIGNNADPDDDNDGLSDKLEIAHNLDPLDNDTDNDGLTDGFEGLVYMDPLNPDTDGDGILDGDEMKNGLDPLEWDTDEDGAIDTEEFKEGTNPHLSYNFPHGLTYDEDLDGEPNNEDDDIDDEGLHNLTEARYRFSKSPNPGYYLDPNGPYFFNPYLADTDGGGISDLLELQKGSDPFDGKDDSFERFFEDIRDADGDGLSDLWEQILGLDLDNLDTDRDGLNDMEELRRGTDPKVRDTDGDGLSDSEELNLYDSDPFVVDTDEDGVSDLDEVNAGTDPDHPLYYPAGFDNDIDGDGIPGDWDWDGDGDGISDDTEGQELGTNPRLADSDGDGVNDGIEIAEGTDPKDPLSFNVVRLPHSQDYVIDTDNDGIPDQLEREIGLDPDNSDTDGDGLKDGIEVAAGLDPFSKDSDGDGLEDGYEAENNLDPFTPDMDNDGLTDSEELFTTGTNPHEWDTDQDDLSDSAEIREGSDPTKKDTDNDGKEDLEDAFPNIGDVSTDPAAYGSRGQIREKRLEMLEENELRREISDMLSDFRARHHDSVMERISDAQTGKVLTDSHGYRVRVEQYVLRPNDKTVQVMNISLRTQEARGLSGLHTLDWKTTFDGSLNDLTASQIRNLPWNNYLNSYTGQIVSPAIPPSNIAPTDMSIELAHNGDFLREVTRFSPRGSETQDVTAKTFSYNLAGFGSGSNIDIKNYGTLTGSTSVEAGAPTSGIDTTKNSTQPQGYILTTDDLGALSSDDSGDDSKSTYKTDGKWPKDNYDSAEYLELGYQPNVPDDATLDAASFNHQYWWAGNPGTSGAKLLVSGDGGTSWAEYPLAAAGNAESSAATDSVDIKSTVDTSAKANNLKVRFMAYSNRASRHDYGLIDLTYSKPVIEPLAGADGNPGGFKYNVDFDKSIYVDFHVIADSGGLASGDFSNMQFNNLGDALRTNLADNPSIDIGENNLEVGVRPSTSEGPLIDLIYIPWNRQHWRDSHSWRRIETGGGRKTIGGNGGGGSKAKEQGNR